MFIQFSNYKFISDISSPAATRGDGDLLIPIETLSSEHQGNLPEQLEVKLYNDEIVIFEQVGKTFSRDSVTNIKEFVGWSYWEVDDSYDLHDVPKPCINVMIVAKNYNIDKHPAPGGYINI